MSEPDETSDRGQTRSLVSRTLSIIGTFQGGRVQQSLSELSRRSGVPVATCHRIVQRLTEWGALERDDQSRYRIGLRLWEVASLAPRATDLQQLARPFVQDLYETTHYTVHLAIREGHELVFIERFQSPRQGSLRPRIGGRYALHATAAGLVLLAHAPEDVRTDILTGDLRRYTEYTYVDPKKLGDALADVRARGYAISDRQVDLTYLAVGAPIFGADGTVVAALSLILAHDDAADEKNIVHLVRLTASGISRALRESRRARTDRTEEQNVLH